MKLLRLESVIKSEKIILFKLLNLDLKNQWSRDDPGFLLILVANLFVSSLALSISFGK
jgi:hypothetical protein